MGKVLLVLLGVVALLAFLGRDADTVSRRDVADSSAQKYSDAPSKQDFARVVIGASGHRCAGVDIVFPPVEMGFGQHVLAMCDTGALYAIGMSWRGPQVNAEPCSTSTSPVCKRD